MLSRRGFLGALAGAAATLVVPKRKVSYFFGMGLPDPELIHGRLYGMKDWDEVVRTWGVEFEKAAIVTTTNPFWTTKQPFSADQRREAEQAMAKAFDVELSGMVDDAEQEIERMNAWLRGEINSDGTRRVALP